MLPASSSDTHYLPGEAINKPAPLRAPRPLWLAALIFLGVFALLQWRWGEARGTWVERLVIHEITVKPAAALIRLISPEIPATPAGASIKAAGGGLNILNGCEGTEVMFLLAAAFAALRLPWRRKLAGLALGLALVFVLNQGRILALFYANRAERGLFDALHTLILPVLLIALVTLYVHAFLHYSRPGVA